MAKQQMIVSASLSKVSNLINIDINILIVKNMDKVHFTEHIKFKKKKVYD